VLTADTNFTHFVHAIINCYCYGNDIHSRVQSATNVALWLVTCRGVKSELESSDCTFWPKVEVSLLREILDSGHILHVLLDCTLYVVSAGEQFFPVMLPQACPVIITIKISRLHYYDLLFEEFRISLKSSLCNMLHNKS